MQNVFCTMCHDQKYTKVLLWYIESLQIISIIISILLAPSQGIARVSEERQKILKVKNLESNFNTNE